MKDTAAYPESDTGLTRPKFLQFCKRMATIDAELEAAKAKRKKLRKEMKLEGINLTNFDIWQRLQSEDETVQGNFFTEIGSFFQWTDNPVAEQMSFAFGDGAAPGQGGTGDDAGDEESDEAALARLVRRARHDGLMASVSGAWEDDNPHDVNTDAGQAWIGGYREAQEQAARNMAPLGAAGGSDDGDGDDDGPEDDRGDPADAVLPGEEGYAPDDHPPEAA